MIVVVLTKECNVMANNDELIRATEYLKLQTRVRINCCYNPARLTVHYFYRFIKTLTKICNFKNNFCTV